MMLTLHEDGRTVKVLIAAAQKPDPAHNILNMHSFFRLFQPDWTRGKSGSSLMRLPSEELRQPPFILPGTPP